MYNHNFWCIVIPKSPDPNLSVLIVPARDPRIHYFGRPNGTDNKTCTLCGTIWVRPGHGLWCTYAQPWRGAQGTCNVFGMTGFILELLENWFYRGMTILFGVLKGAWPVVSMVRLWYNGQKHSLMTDRCLIVQCWHHMLLTRDYPQQGYVAVKTVWSKFHNSHNTRRLDPPKWQIGHMIFDSLWISGLHVFQTIICWSTPCSPDC